MVLDTEDKTTRFPSLGVDAVSLDRYSDVRTAEGEIIIYDEQAEDGWIQSTRWDSADAMV